MDISTAAYGVAPSTNSKGGVLKILFFEK